MADFTRFYVITQNGHILQKGDPLTTHDKEYYVFESVTHPRKVYVTAMWDGQVIHREYYANVLNVGIWDNQYNEWSFAPEWSYTHNPDNPYSLPDNLPQNAPKPPESDNQVISENPDEWTKGNS
jgi:hypothetical protein